LTGLTSVLEEYPGNDRNRRRIWQHQAH